MLVVHSTRELQALADAERSAGRRLALVPTMGALHAGHLSLVTEGRRKADRVWVSIFVNPSQFNDARDLQAYPRSMAEDLAGCREAGVDVVFAPEVDEMYPAGSQTHVAVEELAKPLCGRARPGRTRDRYGVEGSSLLGRARGQQNFEISDAKRRQAKGCFPRSPSRDPSPAIHCVLASPQ